MSNNYIVITKDELELILKNVVKREFSIYIPELQIALTRDEDFVSCKEAAKALGVCRQTLSNWYKSDRTGELVKPYIKKIGGKYLYNILAIKKVLGVHQGAFGKMKNDNYNFQITASDDEKRVRRYEHIDFNLSQHIPISDDDKKFYKNYCIQKGKKSRLRD